MEKEDKWGSIGHPLSIDFSYPTQIEKYFSQKQAKRYIGNINPPRNYVKK